MKFSMISSYFQKVTLSIKDTPVIHGISNMDPSRLLHSWICSSCQQVFQAVLSIFWYPPYGYVPLLIYCCIGKNTGGCELNMFFFFIFLLFLLLGRFIAVKGDIKSRMIWGYQASPIMYGQNAIAINEFLEER
ncbi:hypothetical protein Nepgr_032001 [Nepenthes gracilis]|uniref:Uncharacterized protein n=1 Tax=Nepenthes gracilis TaxID=150966 RepID=A0AAD3TJN4_NEPGR|nr:hypothetical protein Nepgr_032001 [Nepenthes gracilis]